MNQRQIDNHDYWKDYTDRANNFADWFTAIVISNLVYLVQLLRGDSSVVYILENKASLWKLGFNSSCLALGLVFIVKILGILAASIRVDKGLTEGQRTIEVIRFLFSAAFVLLGIFSLLCSKDIALAYFEFLR